MFLVTSITMLRERTTGTLERLMTLPLAKLDLLAGYGIAFALVAALQGAVVAGVAFLLLDLDVAGSADGGPPELFLSRHECKSRTEPPSCLDESSLRAYADLSPTRKLPSRENDAASRM